MTEKASPKFLRIADELRAAIDAGAYGQGDRLPGEKDLAQHHGVGQITARQAIDHLKTQGIAEGRRGSGVYVTAFDPIKRRGIHRLKRTVWGAGRSVWEVDEDRPLAVDQIVIQKEVTAPSHIARVLSAPDQAADMATCVRSRRYSVEGRPVMQANSFFPYALVRDTAITRADTGEGGAYARLAELGHAPVSFREEIRVRLPTSVEAAALEMPLSRAVFKIFRSAFDENEVSVEVNEMTLDTAAYVLQYDIEA